MLKVLHAARNDEKLEVVIAISHVFRPNHN